ncbi:MAG: GTP-binding protein [Intestinibacillus sp.]
MTTKIFVIAGFWEAGETTLIQKLFKGAFQSEKVVLTENHFGDISVYSTTLDKKDSEANGSGVR